MDRSKTTAAPLFGFPQTPIDKDSGVLTVFSGFCCLASGVVGGKVWSW
jgi:hypothetical protein